MGKERKARICVCVNVCVYTEKPMCIHVNNPED